MATRKKQAGRAGSRRGAANGAKRAARKPAARKRTGGAGAADGATMRVRMYRSGLGDSFLLSFPAAQGEFHLLVDCGVFNGTPGEKKKMTDAAADIVQRTGGHLHALAVTHEHYDHLIGFKHAKPAFDGLTVDDVWMSWVEGNSALAKQLKEIQNQLKLSLHQALGALRADPSRSEHVARLQNVLAFGGDPLAANYSVQLGEIMAGLRKRKGKSATLLEPHTSFALPGVAGVRVFVLGPPRDMAGIRRMDDSTKDPQTYRDSAFAVAPFGDFARAVSARVAPDEATKAELPPFESRYARRERDVRAPGYAHGAFFREHYGFTDRESEPWRRIDSDWLGAADQLALQLDSLTNNSSLAMAIELSPAGPVVLMAADAQVGNWLSWHDQPFVVPAEGGAAARRVTAADLLSRTVLYKVGHHGSHNATLKQKGLELMTDDRLTAMIPTDEKWALQKKHWHMPHAPLARALVAATAGRVLRVDHGLPKSGISAAEKARLEARTEVTDLYVELKVAMK